MGIVFNYRKIYHSFLVELTRMNLRGVFGANAIIICKIT